MVVCRASMLCIPATLTMTQCNPMESAPLTDARRLPTMVCRLHICYMQAACIANGAQLNVKLLIGGLYQKKCLIIVKVPRSRKLRMTMPHPIARPES